MDNPVKLRCIIVGEATLPIQCADILLAHGHEILGVISSDPALARWAEDRGIPRTGATSNLVAFASQWQFDYLFSIVNGQILSGELLGLPLRGGINFHDGPLPRYAGFNTPAWALMNGEQRYGVTWHAIGAKVDAGDIYKQRLFDISPGETAFTLNAKCYEAGILSFAEMIEEIDSGVLVPCPQNLAERTFFPRYDRPYAACAIRWNRTANEEERQARALNFGPYANPMGAAKLVVNGRFFPVLEMEARPEAPPAPAGTIRSLDGELIVTTASGDLVLRRLTTLDGEPVTASSLAAEFGLSAGSVLGEVDAALGARITEIHGQISRYEPYWVRRLNEFQPLSLGEAQPDPSRYSSLPVKVAVRTEVAVAAFTVLLARLRNEATFDIGFTSPAQQRNLEGLENLFAPIVPLRAGAASGESFSNHTAQLRDEMEQIGKARTWVRDLATRYPELRSKPELRQPVFPVVASVVTDVNHHQVPPGCVLALVIPESGGECRWVWNSAALADVEATVMLRQFLTLLETAAAAPESPVAELPLLTREERHQLLVEWNDTATDFAAGTCIHEFFEAQARRTPDAVAVVYEDRQLTYRELNSRSNRVAAYLRTMGAGPETLVAISVERSLDMMVGLLGILKAGGAYLPLDPAYPRERLAVMLEDSGAKLLLTQQKLLHRLPPVATAVCLDTDWEIVGRQPDDNPASGVTASNLAYVIYTSGSTGKPKGVMVTHRNVANFFAGMDRVIGREQPGVWLAVTSISFDISVLELFWTLARGFEVVIAGDEHRVLVAESSVPQAARPLEFSLFYFATNQSGANVADKYRLLLEGARFADQHGFDAVWTPERHFHSFGGLYPNPSVASAAIAAITSRVKIRAGSVVLPLHHPARVAEEWAVVDNLSGGRVGISFASGWHARDFVLMPGNYADNKNVMFRHIDVVRKLWRGEAVSFPDGKGNDTEVRILPRPVQPELPVWVTAAGNPETFRMAGALGFNMLTHLLGQRIEDVAEKIAIYRAARKEHGFDPDTGHVTLMLHTFVGNDLDEVRETVRKPMTEYLATSLDLIKNSPWSFPAFAKRPGVDPRSLDLSTLDPEEKEALLGHAFERYFETSGFFGTPDGCVALAERLQAAGVDEIACLIDFGVETDAVLACLESLNAVRQRYNARRETGLDYSLPAQIRRRHITHLQCTPSMAKMLLMAPASRTALGSLDKLMIGGEALPPGLAGELADAVRGDIHNMYGPTETTVWSTTAPVRNNEAVTIGRPIANTQIYLLDSHFQPTPPGVPGELAIGGAGVVRGYLHRPDLTAERFIRDPFSAHPDARLYRTGDLARYLPDGRIEFLGRLDHQVKIRGYRIEMGEIEAALAQYPGVNEVVVVANENAGDKFLSAYIVSGGKQSLAVEELRRHLAARLPDYMVPSVFVLLDALPRTPNGKIDRKKLPTADRIEAREVECTPVVNEMEQTIVSIWQEALNRTRIGRDDNFFDLGGHSILVVQVNSRLREVLGREISLIEMFRFTTVRSLAEHLSRENGQDKDAGSGRARLRKEMLARRGGGRRRAQENSDSLVAG